MRIAISADGPSGLDAPTAAHFGRCPYYVLVDWDEGKVIGTQVVENPYFGNHTPGAIPEFIHGQGAQVMIAGGMGQRAVAFFQQFGIEPVTGASGTVQQTLNLYLDGSLTGTQPCVEGAGHSHGCHE
jgi:predicted Fe-Mo cluster-binding NifX family protein